MFALKKDEQGQPKPLSVGPAKVLYAPPDGAGNSGSWAYVEPSAQSLTFLAGDIKETKQDLRELGRQPLTATANVTVINSAMAASKAKSAVGAWAIGLKDALENAMEMNKMDICKDVLKFITIFEDTRIAIDAVYHFFHLLILMKSSSSSRDRRKWTKFSAFPTITPLLTEIKSPIDHARVNIRRFIVRLISGQGCGFDRFLRSQIANAHRQATLGTSLSCQALQPCHVARI